MKHIQIKEQGKSAMQDTPKLNELLCFSLYSTSLAMNKLYRKLLKPLGITYPQYLVLILLWHHKSYPMSNIGEDLFLDSATLTPLLKRMESANLLTRRRDKQDERHVIIELTEQGQALESQVENVFQEAMCASQLSLEDIGRTKHVVDALRQNLVHYNNSH
ncbi:MarR family winged helix-turn-helix transcriptional regulator [Marinomonas spartinae]|nr:MarR family transcriptional regulator [Marinomonas spartinae]